MKVELVHPLGVLDLEYLIRVRAGDPLSRRSCYWFIYIRGWRL